MGCQASPTCVVAIICLLLGSYQISMTVYLFYVDPVGTQVKIMMPTEAFGEDMKVLYCVSDWMDAEKFKEYGLEESHKWYLAYWLEILSGEHERFDGKRAETSHVDESSIHLGENVVAGNVRRSLRYLDSIDFISKHTEDVATEWRYLLGAIHNTTIEGSAAWDYTKPRMIEAKKHIFQKTHRDLEAKFGQLTSSSVSKMFMKLSFDPLVSGQSKELEFRYGQVCYRASMKPAINMEVLLKRPMIARREPLPNKESPAEILERHSTFPAGIHVSPYIGGMYPVWGGDDDNAYRMNTLTACISGGYLIRASPTYEVEEQGSSYPAKQFCENPCVDRGLQVDPMVVAIKRDARSGQQIDQQLSGSQGFQPDQTDTCGNMVALACERQAENDGGIGGSNLNLGFRETENVESFEAFQTAHVAPISDGGQNKTVEGSEFLAPTQNPELWEGQYIPQSSDGFGPAPSTDLLKTQTFGSMEGFGQSIDHGPEIQDPANLMEFGTGSSFDQPTENLVTDDYCKDGSLLAKNTKLNFGNQMLISVFTLHAKWYKRLSTRTSKCSKSVNKTDMLPVYQEKSKCLAVCQDKHVHRAFGNCSVSGLIFPDYLQNAKIPDILLCDITAFWANMEHLKKPEVKAQVTECVEKCGNIPKCDTYQAYFRRGMDVSVKHESNDSYNFHKLVVTPVDIEVTEEFKVLPWDTFVANVGGLFGFFLGLSLLQVIMWPVEAFDSWKKGKKTNGKKDNDKNVSA